MEVSRVVPEEEVAKEHMQGGEIIRVHQGGKAWMAWRRYYAQCTIIINFVIKRRRVV